MAGFNLETLFTVINWFVWSALAALGCQAVMIFVDSIARGRKERRQAASIGNLARQLPELALKQSPSNGSGTLAEWTTRVLGVLQARKFCCPDLRTVLECVVLDRSDEAHKTLTNWEESRIRGALFQTQYGVIAQRIGLGGTVIGIWQGFVGGDGSSLSLADLGFALGTTIAGLTIATVIDYAVFVIFEPAWARSNVAARDAFDIWSGIVRDQRLKLHTPDASRSQVLETLKQINDQQSALQEVAERLEANDGHEALSGQIANLCKAVMQSLDVISRQTKNTDEVDAFPDTSPFQTGGAFPMSFVQPNDEFGLDGDTVDEFYSWPPADTPPTSNPFRRAANDDREGPAGLVVSH